MWLLPHLRGTIETPWALLSGAEAQGCYVCSATLGFLKLALAHKNREKKLNVSNQKNL